MWSAVVRSRQGPGQSCLKIPVQSVQRSMAVPHCHIRRYDLVYPAPEGTTKENTDLHRSPGPPTYAYSLYEDMQGT